jgi:hypothetical protein
VSTLQGDGVVSSMELDAKRAEIASLLERVETDAGEVGKELRTMRL